MPQRTLSAWVVMLVLWSSCTADAVSGDVATLLLDKSAERHLDTRTLRFEPADNLQAADLDARGRLVVQRKDRKRSLRVVAPGLCPVVVPPGDATQPLRLLPVLDLGGDRIAVGFDARFQIQVRHNCPELGRGAIRWRQLEGPPLADFSASDSGYVLSARTARFEQVHPEPVPRGIVPISPRTQARVVLEASWNHAGSDEAADATRRLVIAATPRATGLSSVAVSQQILLSGTGWRVQSRPPGGHADVTVQHLVSTFAADAPGQWTLVQGDEPPLIVQALTHDLTPYDCGRAECHAALSSFAATSPMSHALSSRLSEAVGYDAVSCMLQCHVVGERGVHDGGFHAVADALEFTWTEQTRWDELPRSLRRLGGVRCTSCHGPGAIPPPGRRAAVLASDVCASCHDAPPRYVHVAQWRSSRMASSDRHPGVRDAACARCHTTDGFLAHIGARKPARDSELSSPVGIACAACHAPHAEHSGEHLLRAAPTQALDLQAPLVDARAALCAQCHSQAPQQPEVAPSGALFWGELRVPSQGAWEPLAARSAHDMISGGCVGCHGGGGQPGLDHSFGVEARVCEGCHLPGALGEGRAMAARLQARAAALVRELARGCGDEPQLTAAHGEVAAGGCGAGGEARARYELGVVLGDAALMFHNAALSRMLLADAERLLRSRGAR